MLIRFARWPWVTFLAIRDGVDAKCTAERIKTSNKTKLKTPGIDIRINDKPCPSISQGHFRAGRVLVHGRRQKYSRKIILHYKLDKMMLSKGQIHIYS